jgi:hypothetical protein
MEGMFTKMWDPPTESPVTPDMVAPTNPIPELLFAAGISIFPPPAPHTMRVDLLHGIKVPTWDTVFDLEYFVVVNPDIPLSANGTYPSFTIRVPCGAIFHAATSGKGPPPHTIHWHGVEPTPMNDGVGHCSMEIGGYTYQWQGAFVGSYFYHCHRNTMQHFEFGLYGLLLIDPADAYFATQVDPSIPMGHGRDGKRRTGANLQSFPRFPGWVGGNRTDPDPWTGNPALRMENLQPQIGNINPHAMTVPYDVEALWVLDDRDSTWAENADDARATFPRQGDTPGYNDDFARNPGRNGFFAFNDYRADYWFVTGVPVPAPIGGTGTIPAGLTIPLELNCGVVGSQISVEGYVGQTILVRALDAAYNNVIYTFPVDVVIIEWDGRPLGVPPYGFNEAYLVPKNTPIEVSVGRRFSALIREFSPVSDFAVCKFIDTRGAHVPDFEQVTCTARIPINISPITVTTTTDKTSPQQTGTAVTFTATMTGTPGSLAPTSGFYEHQFWIYNGTSWSMVQNYSLDNTWALPGTTPPGKYVIAVHTRLDASLPRVSAKYTSFEITAGGPATGVTITPDQPNPHTAGTAVLFTAAGQGSANYDYRFKLYNGATATWSLVQNYGNGNTWTLPANTPIGKYVVAVDVRTSSAVDRDAVAYFSYEVTAGPATGVTLTPDQPSPHPAGTAVLFTAAGQGSANYDYRFKLYNATTATWSLVQNYGNGNTWTLPANTPPGNYVIAVDVRTSSVVNRDAVTYFSYQVVN